MEKCTVVYKAPAVLVDIGATARQIIDDVLTVQAASGTNFTSKAAADKALFNIQRQARNLLAREEAFQENRFASLVELVTRMERGAVVPVNELRQTLTILDVAAAKIRNHLSGGAGNGMGQPVA